MKYFPYYSTKSIHIILLNTMYCTRVYSIAEVKESLSFTQFMMQHGYKYTIYFFSKEEN